MTVFDPFLASASANKPSTSNFRPPTAAIYIGTSGYSYRDWQGYFYPRGLAAKDMLPYYAREFNFTEINSSYYALPRPRNLEQMARKVPEGFIFAVKAYRTLTHDRGESVTDDSKQFRQALQPLVDQGRLGAVLLQFPYSFHNNQANREYLVRLRELLPDLPLVVEFRHAGWVHDAVRDFLARNELAYTCVDEPDLPGLPGPVVYCTAPVAYVRFHGRNAAKWWRHEEAYERYDYLYTEAELKEWLPGIAYLAGQARQVFVAFNNHYHSQAVTNARMLKELLAAGQL
ncbi:hypothetical protein MTCOM_02840 [Moorella thermoacetica]|uniref:DUF72 domain-containing protein n=1 Tax=Neomoorella thermoacetica TaxID=1525 RepID=A0A1J5JGU2_NEOTH|nr:DUF72 domain-containing protein [Moorella thermoacetica]OIQ08766.1 hypothetical protein MOOR_16860 [Moorella thermoacetica]